MIVLSALKTVHNASTDIAVFELNDVSIGNGGLTGIEGTSPNGRNELNRTRVDRASVYGASINRAVSDGSWDERIRIQDVTCNRLRYRESDNKSNEEQEDG